MQDKSYDDIIDLPHHTSARHAPMSRESRAAQFAPFAALVGYDDAVKEEARLTGRKVDLSEDRIALINQRVFTLSQRLDERPTVSITFFKHDARKKGGEYITVCGIVHAVDEVCGVIIMSDKRKIAIEDVLSVEGEIFGCK